METRRPFSRDLESFLNKIRPLMYVIRAMVKSKEVEKCIEAREAVLLLIQIVEGKFGYMDFEVFDQRRRREKEVVNRVHSREMPKNKGKGFHVIGNRVPPTSIQSDVSSFRPQMKRDSQPLYPVDCPASPSNEEIRKQACGPGRLNDIHIRKLQGPFTVMMRYTLADKPEGDFSLDRNQSRPDAVKANSLKLAINQCRRSLIENNVTEKEWQCGEVFDCRMTTVGKIDFNGVFSPEDERKRRAAAQRYIAP